MKPVLLLLLLTSYEFDQQETVKQKSKTVQLKYRVSDQTKITSSILWVTTDAGKEWKTADKFLMSPQWTFHNSTITCNVLVPADGTYGFKPQFGDEVTNTSPEPKPGDKPKQLVIIDSTPPILVNSEPLDKSQSSSEINLKYTYRDLCDVKVSAIWVTKDNGKSWINSDKLSYKTDFNYMSGFVIVTINVDHEGTFGFYPQLSDALGNSNPEPVPDQKPINSIKVFAMPPKILNPKSYETLIAGVPHLIKWASFTAEVKEKSTSLHYSFDDITWKPIATGLESSGIHFWVPPSVQTENLKIRAVFITKDGSEAKTVSGPFNIIIEPTPDIEAARNHYSKARLYYAQKRFEEAFLEYEKALIKWPKFADALNDIGLIYFEKKEYVKSIELFNRAKDSEISNPLYHSNLARAFIAIGVIDEAYKSLRDASALKLDRDHYLSYATGEMLLVVAKKFLEIGSKDKAIQAAKTVLKLELTTKRLRESAEKFIRDHDR